MQKHYTAEEIRELVNTARKNNETRRVIPLEDGLFLKREAANYMQLADALEQMVTDFEEVQYFIGLARATFMNSDLRGDPAIEMEAILASVHEPMFFHRALNRAKMKALDDLLAHLTPGRVTILVETVEKARDAYAIEALKEKVNA